MHKSIQVGNRFTTGQIQFEIVKIEYENIYNSIIWVRLLNSGYFSHWLIDWKSCDIGAGIISGEIFLIDKKDLK